MVHSKSVLEERLALENDLSDDWKSAQSVSSLYDAYLDLKKQNDILSTAVYQIEHEKENIKSQYEKLQYKFNQQNCSVIEHLEYDGRIEKLSNQKESYEESCKLLKSENMELKEMYNKLLSKYEKQMQMQRDRLKMDPHESNRVQLAMKTLSDSLTEALHDKELLSGQLEEMKNEMSGVKNSKMVVDLELIDLKMSLDTSMKNKMKHTMMFVLRRLYSRELNFGFSKWKHYIVQLKNSKAENQYANHIKTLHEHKLTLIFAKMLQSSTMRVFKSWQSLTRKNLKRIIAISNLAANKYIAELKFSLRQWMQYSKNRWTNFCILRKMINRLQYRVCNNTFRFWSRQCQRYSASVLQLEKQKYNTEMKRLSLLLKQKNDQYTSLEAQHQYSMVARFQIVSKHRSLNRIINGWRKYVSSKIRCAKREYLVENKLYEKKLKNTILLWHRQTQVKKRNQRLLTRVAHQFTNRQVGKCMNSWKEYVGQCQKTKNIISLYVKRLQNQHAMHCFFAWKTFKVERQQFRQYWTRAARIFQSKYAEIHFGYWKHSIAKANRRMSQQLLTMECLSKLRAKTLDSTFDGWKRYVTLNSQIRVLLQNMVVRRDQAMKLRQFSIWKKISNEIKDKEMHDKYAELAERAKLLEQQLNEKHVENESLQTHIQVQTKDQDAKTNLLMKKVIEGFHSRNQARMFKCWANYVEEKKQKEGVLRTFLLQWTQNKLSAMFHGWRDNVRERLHNRQIVQKFAFRITFQSAAKCFASWKTFADCKQHQQKVVRGFVLKMKETTQSRCYFCWKQYYEERSTYRKSINQMISHLHLRRNRLRFHKWVDFTLDDKAMSLIDLLLTRLCQRTFNCWKVYKKQYQHRRQSMAIMETKLRDHSLCASFKTWNEFVVDRNVNRAIIRKLYRMIYNRKTSVAYLRWKSYNQFSIAKKLFNTAKVAEEHHDEVTELKTQIKAMRRRSMAIETQNHKLIIDKVSKETEQRRLREAFGAFRQYMSDVHLEKQLKLEPWFTAWKQYYFDASKKRKFILLLQQESETLIQDTFREWKMATKRSSKIAAQRFLRLWQGRSKSGIFNAWKWYVKLFREQKLALQQLCQKRTLKTQLQGFALWKVKYFTSIADQRCLVLQEKYKKLESQLVEKEVAMKMLNAKYMELLDEQQASHAKKLQFVASKTLKLWQTRSTAMIFQRWRRYVEKIIRDRIVSKKFLLKWTNRSLSVTFTRWQSYTRVRTQVGHIRRNIYTRFQKRHTKAVFLEWKNYTIVTIRCRGIIDQLATKTTKGSFMQWKRQANIWKRERQQKYELIRLRVKGTISKLIWRLKGEITAGLRNAFSSWKSNVSDTIIFSKPSSVLTIDGRPQDPILGISHLLQHALYAIHNAKSLNELFFSVSQAITSAFSGCNAILLLANDERNTLWSIDSQNEIVELPSNLGLTGYTLNTRRTLHSKNIFMDSQYSPIVDQVIDFFRNYNSFLLPCSITSHKLFDVAPHNLMLLYRI